MPNLRDINLRIQDEPIAPSWIWRANAVEYFFALELERLKLNVGGVVKINVFCCHPQFDEKIVVDDGIACVNVSGCLADGDNLGSEELNLDFLVDGFKKLLNHFDIQSLDISSFRSKVVQATLNYSLPVGKKSIKTSTGHSLRLYVRSFDDFRACVVTLCIFKSKNIFAEATVCTTFPDPERAIGDFQSLSIDEKNEVTIEFRAAAMSGKVLYGRKNYDHIEFANVTRKDNSEPSPPYFIAYPTFVVNLNQLLT
jgi:hypothetical protein